jgi:hypothetical protein
MSQAEYEAAVADLIGSKGITRSDRLPGTDPSGSGDRLALRRRAELEALRQEKLRSKSWMSASACDAARGLQ